MNQSEFIYSVVESTNLSHRKIAEELGISHTLFNKYANNMLQMPSELFIVLNALRNIYTLNKQLEYEAVHKNQYTPEYEYEIYGMIEESENIVQNYKIGGNIQFLISMFNNISEHGKKEFLHIVKEIDMYVLDKTSPLIDNFQIDVNNITSSEIGEMLRFVIKKMLVSQKTIAQSVALSPSRLSEIIAGNFNINSENSIENIKLIANALNISPKFFIYTEDDPAYFLFTRIVMFGEFEKELMNSIDQILFIDNFYLYEEIFSESTQYIPIIKEDKSLSYVYSDALDILIKNAINHIKDTEVSLENIKEILMPMCEYYEAHLSIPELFVQESTKYVIVDTMVERFVYTVYSILLEVLLYKDKYTEESNISAFEKMYYRDGEIKDKDVDLLLKGFDEILISIYKTLISAYQDLGSFYNIRFNFDVRDMFCAQAAQVARKIIVEIEDFDKVIYNNKETMDNIIQHFIEINYVESKEYKEHENEATRNKRTLYALVMNKIEFTPIKEEEEEK
ncbi:helix-turn-helix domain-containing protein [Macrococcoides canis]|uniref:helix-turn-helix domain-containing protein n=1 Tax=Macrococcoides canis TaxID=1855823 RepID=UPI001B8C3317|nr:helix-turn-helix transcriptional regulator [Macrococcus canis]QUR94130.1 hypothetical protein GOY09_03795 [Macrococcus canis]UTH07356.1 helix-turn-helix transcriptional regulator [Macrococcus canis]